MTEQVTHAYGACSAEYIDVLGSIEATAEADRTAVLTWAETLTGLVLDVGCGPGQWTHFLSQHGIEVCGIDPTPEFIASAKERYPCSKFREGRAEDLEVDAECLGGILSWYSLIHTAPTRIDVALREFSRSLRPGGGLAVGFFEGPKLEPFNHAVATAYYWPVDSLSEHIEAAGFTLTHTETRSDPGTRKHGLILAKKPSASRPSLRVQTGA